MFTTDNGSSILTPAQTLDLIIDPIQRDSIATQVAHVIKTTSHSVRVPRITSDVTASWTAEGEEIAASEPDVDELHIEPSKLASLTAISRELARDSAPEAARIVGASIVRDLTRQVDAAFLGTVPAPAPSGLPALEGVTEVSGTLTDLDTFVDASAEVANAGGNITSWIAHPNDAAELAKIKAGTGMNSALLAVDPTQSARRIVEGSPLYVTPACDQGTVWGVTQTAAVVIIREDAEVITDQSVYFASDRLAVRGILRLGWGFPTPEHIAKITIS